MRYRTHVILGSECVGSSILAVHFSFPSLRGVKHFKVSLTTLTNDIVSKTFYSYVRIVKKPTCSPCFSR